MDDLISKIIKSNLSLIIFLLITPLSLHAEPWFTGPILAPSGVTMPAGHANVEIYAFYATDHSTYNRHGKLTPTPAEKTQQYQALFSYGFTDYVDMQLTLPYILNWQAGQHGQGVGDFNGLLGFQALRQFEHKYLPDLRILLQETLPSGKYDNLNPEFLGTNVTGKGSYQTTFSMAFQYLSHISELQYLQSRLTLNYTLAAPTRINGFGTYGGNSTTQGRVNPGNNFSIDLSGEFSLNQNWVAVMEAYYFRGNKSSFVGNRGINKLGRLNIIGYPGNDEISLAPAFEYNYSENVGIIAGYWYVIKGKATPNFKSPVIALNLYL